MYLKPYLFKKPAHRPFIYASFVSTLDGKIIVKKPGYWPIGTVNDYTHFTHLRAHADVIIDGKNTALMFGQKTIETIQSDLFATARKELGKTEKAEYIVVTGRPDDELLNYFDGEYKPYLATNQASSTIQYDKDRIISIDSSNHVDLVLLMQEIETRGWKNVYIDGGPTLIAQLLQKELLDELFITISPKIFGSKEGVTLTMVEGQLFSPEKIKQFKLISTEVDGDEVFLRYKIK